MRIICFFLILCFLFSGNQLYSNEMFLNPRVSQENKFLWFRVPKAGWCTITDILSRNFNLMPDRSFAYRSRDFPGFYKFAFVRNPWDRVVSCYFDKIVRKKYPFFRSCWDKDFDYFVDFIDHQNLSRNDPHIALQTSLFPVEEMDFIGRFESFEEDLTFVLQAIGAKDQNFGHKNASKHQHYSLYYTERTREIIAKKYKADIDAFGYQFETE